MQTIHIIIVVLLLKSFQLNGQVIDTISVGFKTNTPSGNKSSCALKGLTFVEWGHLIPFGIDLVGCRDWTGPKGMDCNAYQGDTTCDQQRSILCVRVDNSPRPPYVISGNGAAYFYAGWNLGHISIPLPTTGISFGDREVVDAFCAKHFGAGWRVATFHDGKYIPNMNRTIYVGESWTANIFQIQTGGCHYYSYGDIRNDTRFWIHIGDQPANCWNN